jgi:hypothetical protein
MGISSTIYQIPVQQRYLFLPATIDRVVEGLASEAPISASGATFDMAAALPTLREDIRCGSVARPHDRAVLIFQGDYSAVPETLSFADYVGLRHGSTEEYDAILSARMRAGLQGASGLNIQRHQTALENFNRTVVYDAGRPIVSLGGKIKGFNSLAQAYELLGAEHPVLDGELVPRAVVARVNQATFMMPRDTPFEARWARVMADTPQAIQPRHEWNALSAVDRELSVNGYAVMASLMDDIKRVFGLTAHEAPVYNGLRLVSGMFTAMSGAEEVLEMAAGSRLYTREGFDAAMRKLNPSYSRVRI